MDTRLTLALGLWFLLFALSLLPIVSVRFRKRFPWVNQVSLFLVVLCVAFPAWRWRSLSFLGEINVDEGTTIAQGMKYLVDPVPWRSVDGVTCGPLSTWVILWAPIFGVKLSYLSLRVTAIGLIVLSLLGSLLCFREIFGKRLAFLAVLVPASLLLTSLNFDFVTFAMEYLPMAMGIWSVYLLIRIFRQPSQGKLLALGIITGAMPFSKLQAAPSAVFLFAIGVFFAWKHSTGSNPNEKAVLNRATAALMLVIGGLSVPTLILAPVALAGIWNDFVYFYILCGTTYQANLNTIPVLDYLLRGSSDFGALFAGSVLAAFALAIGLVGSRIQKSALRQWLIGAAVVMIYFGVLLYSVLRSGYYFPHYLLLLVFPTSLILAWAVRGQVLYGGMLGSGRKRVLLIAGVLIVTLGAQGVVGFREYRANAPLLKNWGEEQNPLFEVIQKLTVPGDSMAIWGWSNKLHARTGIPPATRFVGLTYVMNPSPRYNRQRELFLQDLKTSRAKLFLDAVDEFRWPSWPPGEAARHFMMPELAQWIQQEYQLAGEVQTAPNRLPVRVYVRKSP